MTTKPPEDDLPGEFLRLGHNLRDAVKAVWDSEEGRRLQRDIKTGLSALEAGLKEAAEELTQSEVGQRVKDEMHDLGQRVRAGDVESRVKSDLLEALRTVNRELQKVSRRAGQPPSDQPPTE